MEKLIEQIVGSCERNRIAAELLDLRWAFYKRSLRTMAT